MTPSTTRRRFLAGGLSLPLWPQLLPRSPRSGASKKLLILGGTRFLGPAIVEAALAGGWEVTLFNRGKSNPQLFPDLEKLRGDRDKGELDALAGRKWDAVVDTSGYVPGQVQAAAELLADNVGFYVFISTVSVYADQSADNVDEDTPVATVEPEVIEQVKTIRQSFRHYGAMKALCEQAAEKAMPGRVANIRPGLIVGPNDSSDRFTYWPVRVHRGGEILAPDDPNGEVQFIDVRDLGAWSFEMAANKTPGTFNAVGFDGRLSMQELLHGCKVVIGSNCWFTWVDAEFLKEHKVAPYRDLPLWLPPGMRGHFDVTKAIAAGLTFRPPGDTIRATLDWHLANRKDDHRWRSGLTPEREAELLAEWAKR